MKWLGLPIDASANGSGVDSLIFYVHILMVVLFVGWLIYFAYTLIRFRESKTRKADYAGVKNHLSNYVEGGVILCEALLLIGCAIPVWAKAVSKFPDESQSTVIQIMAQQFAWNARYAGPDGVLGKNDPKFVSATNPWGIDPDDPNGRDDVAVVNDLVVPVDKPVIVHISSKDVIHCFKIMPMRVTQDAIPGMSIPAWFKPVKEGKYEINCAQLCGNSHYSMKGTLEVVSEVKYRDWLSSKAKAFTPGAGATGEANPYE